MCVTEELSLRRELTHGLLLKHSRIALEVVEYLRLQYHEAAVDDGSVLVVLLAECKNLPLVVLLKNALLLRKAYGRHSCYPAVLLVKSEKCIEVHIRHAVSVGEQETLILQILLCAQHSAAGHGVETGIQNGYLPVLTLLVVHLHLVG